MVFDGKIPADPHFVVSVGRVIDDAEDVADLVRRGVGDVVDEKGRAFVVTPRELNVGSHDDVLSKGELRGSDGVVGKRAFDHGDRYGRVGTDVVNAK